MITEFDTIGFSVDYLIAGKYKGSIRLEEKDRDTFGYHGRKTETLTEAVTFKNGKKIKAGQVVTTELFPLNGRIKK